MTANFHTHTCFCDGSDTPGALAEQALALGFTALGFSGHIDPDCGMTAEGEQEYRRRIQALRQEYAGRLSIFCGVEQDSSMGRVDPFYDYAIGSVHYLPIDGELHCIDWSRDRTLALIRDHFDGDPLACAEAYFAKMGRALEVTGTRIVGHLDLITKFDEPDPIFDQSSPRYRRAVLDALDALEPYDPIFEINTGAMAKGYRTAPYPAFWILQELRRRDRPILIGSDCHDRRFLDCGYSQARDLALRAGYSCQLTLTDHGWTSQPF